jgi:hypothetical protein
MIVVSILNLLFLGSVTLEQVDCPVVRELRQLVDGLSFEELRLQVTNDMSELRSRPSFNCNTLRDSELEHPAKLLTNSVPQKL